MWHKRQDYWLMDSTTNMYVCNNLRLMTDFAERLIRIRKSILGGVSPSWRIVQIRLVLENRTEEIILNHYNVYYLSNNLSNLISLSLFNNADIHYNNKQQALYDKTSQKSFAFT